MPTLGLSHGASGRLPHQGNAHAPISSIVNPDVLAPHYPADRRRDQSRVRQDQGPASTRSKSAHIEQVVLTTPELEKAFTDAKGRHALRRRGDREQGHAHRFRYRRQSRPHRPDARRRGVRPRQERRLHDHPRHRRASGPSPSPRSRPAVQLSYDDAKPDIAKRLALAEGQARVRRPPGPDRIPPRRPEAAQGNRRSLQAADRDCRADRRRRRTLGRSGPRATPTAPRSRRRSLPRPQGKLAPTINFGSTSNAWFDLSKVDPRATRRWRRSTTPSPPPGPTTRPTPRCRPRSKSIVAELDARQELRRRRNRKEPVRHRRATPITRQGDQIEGADRRRSRQARSSPPARRPRLGRRR